MSFWKGKKVLITGHTGFQGSWLSLWLQHLQAEVTGVALPPPTMPNMFTQARVGDGMQSIMADVRNANAIKQLVISQQPEIIFHLAAQPLVRYSYDNPAETYSTNVMGTVHVLDAARAADCVRAVVNVTSDKCYDNREWCWGYRESDNLGGYDPYSSSKACAELVTSAYRDSYFRHLGIGLATARAGNVIGGGDWANDRLVPDVIRACMNKTTLDIRHSQAMRPWQHVLQPLSGYLRLAEGLYSAPLDYSESWNFGPEDHDIQSVDWMADYITQRWGGTTNWVQAHGQQMHEANQLKLDCSKAKSRLGWKPQSDLISGLNKTIDWYKAYLADENMHEFTLAQIQGVPVQKKQRANAVGQVEVEVY
jgi:CDP-glucose 4,6-dehydratase